jgi:hypothetical protein
MSELEESRKMSQYELELKLDRMTQRAFGDKVQKPPRKPLSVVDAEVIKEYQKQFNEPVREYEMEIDEETGEERIRLDLEGNPIYKVKTKKFRVVPPPELDVVEEEELHAIPTDEELNIVDLEVQKAKLILDQRKQYFKDMVAVRKEIIKSIDDLPQPSLYLETAPLQTGIKGIREVSTIKKNPNYGKQREVIEQEKERIIARLEEVDANLDFVKAEIDRMIEGLAEYNIGKARLPELRRENEARKAQVKQINSARVKNYQETLNLMNRGAFQQDQKPDESEEEYVARLQANAEQEYTDETLFEADMDIKLKFKEALKKLIRDDAKIEQVANSIRDDEIEIKNEILKKYPLFRKKFLDIYGLNNPAVNVVDIKTFIDAFIKSIRGNDALLNLIQEPETKQENRTALELAEQDKQKVYIIENPTNFKKVYFRLGESMDDNGLYLLFSLTGKRNSYREFIPSDADLTPPDLANDRENSFKEIKNATGITKAVLQSKFNNKPYSVKWTLWLNGKIDTTTDFDEIPARYENAYEFQGQDYGATMGWGIKSEEIPDIVDFGKIKIALNKLFYKNILSARHKNLGRIAGFQNVKVSDDLVAIIMKLVKGEKLIKQEIDALQKSEQILYDKLLSLANLHKKAPSNRDSTIVALKERMDLIGGSIEAGNDNKDLVKELYNIVHALKNFGVITNKEATKYLSQF